FVSRFMLRLPPRSARCPYTTLFRSADTGCAFNDLQAAGHDIENAQISDDAVDDALAGQRQGAGFQNLGFAGLVGVVHDDDDAARSEEHTSELQSRENLVCRLLLEKK